MLVSLSIMRTSCLFLIVFPLTILLFFIVLIYYAKLTRPLVEFTPTLSFLKTCFESSRYYEFLLDLDWLLVLTE